MQVRPLDAEMEARAHLPAPPDLDGPDTPFLALVEMPARADHLPDDWTTVGPVLVAGRTLDRVVVGPNGVFAVSLDPDPRPATLSPDGLFRGASGSPARSNRLSPSASTCAASWAKPASTCSPTPCW